MTRKIEDILSNMPLRQPPASLDERIAAEAAEARAEAAAPAPLRGPWPYLAAAAAVAALVAFAVFGPGLTGPVDHGTEPADDLAVVNPVRNDTVVSQLTDEGVIYLDEHTPVRQIRRRDIQRVTWTDANHDIHIETTVPREETWLVPVDFD